MNPAVTVLMSVYNGEAYLEAAIQSILNQSFSDFELLIIDDCSTDGSASLLHQFKDSRIRVLRNEVNSGLTRSLNKGISLAKGKYLARMDADDISLPERLGLQYDFLESNPKYGLVGAERNILYKDHLKAKRGEVMTTHEAICVQQLFRNAFIHSAVMMRTSLAKLLHYDETIYAAQDYDLWLRISKQTKVANLPIPLINYRVHAESISETRLEKQIETVQAMHRRQLLAWGLLPTQQELDIHLLVGLTMTDRTIKNAEVQAAGDWLLKLIQHNEARPAYDAVAVFRVFQCLWRGVFNRKNSKVTLSYLWANWRHPLNKGFRTKAIVFVHCAKHYPVFRWFYALLRKR